MFLEELEIDGNSVVAEIVQKDYRTADVFLKYDIEYCCGGKWPLSTICMMKGIDEKNLVAELKKAAYAVRLPPSLAFEKWDIDFLIDYIINIHHAYLEKMLPDLQLLLIDFADDHSKKYPYLLTLLADYTRFKQESVLHLQHEEEVIFPYLRQVAHAYENKDSYAAQLVRTLRKPVDKMKEEDQGLFIESIFNFRNVTNNYTAPERACTNHKVVLSKFKELDNDLVQHVYLENEVLFPRIIAMEKELLNIA